MIIGANPEHLRELARALRGESNNLFQVVCSLSRSLRSAPWHGRDATAFRGDWGELERVVKEAAEALARAANELLRQAQAQQETSSDGEGLGPVVWRVRGPWLPVDQMKNPPPRLVN